MIPIQPGGWSGIITDFDEFFNQKEIIKNKLSNFKLKNTLKITEYFDESEVIKIHALSLEPKEKRRKLLQILSAFSGKKLHDFSGKKCLS